MKKIILFSLIFSFIFTNNTEAKRKYKTKNYSHKLFTSSFHGKISENKYEVRMSTYYDNGSNTSSGLKFYTKEPTIAYHHLKDIPHWSIIKITYKDKSEYAVVTDHGPFIKTDPTRLADASPYIMKKLRGFADGVIKVTIEVIGKSNREQSIKYIKENNIEALADLLRR